MQSEFVECTHFVLNEKNVSIKRSAVGYFNNRLFYFHFTWNGVRACEQHRGNSSLSAAVLSAVEFEALKNELPVVGGDYRTRVAQHADSGDVTIFSATRWSIRQVPRAEIRPVGAHGPVQTSAGTFLKEMYKKNNSQTCAG